jgi:hypothetical protein
LTIMVKEIDELGYANMFGRVFMLWKTYRAVENF